MHERELEQELVMAKLTKAPNHASNLLDHYFDYFPSYMTLSKNKPGLTSSNMSRRTLDISHFATISINAPEEVKNNYCGNASRYMHQPHPCKFYIVPNYYSRAILSMHCTISSCDELYTFNMTSK